MDFYLFIFENVNADICGHISLCLASGIWLWHLAYDIWYMRSHLYHILNMFKYIDMFTCSHVHISIILKMWTQINAVTFLSLYRLYRLYRPYTNCVIVLLLLCYCYCVIVIVILLLFYCYCVIVIVLLFLCYWNIGTFEHVISAFNILSAFTFLGWGFGFRTYRYINISIWFMLSEPNISLSYQKVTHWLWSVFNIWTLEFLNVWYLHSTSYLLSKFLSALTFLWHLASGIWHLASGIWHLSSEIWNL